MIKLHEMVQKGSSYLRVDPENYILFNKSYFKSVPEYDENKITKNQVN